MKHCLKSLFVIIISFLLLISFCISSQALTETDKIIIAFGDSITASGAWFSLSQQAYGISIINMGIGSETSSNGLSRIEKIISRKPDVVTLSFGMNDASLDMDRHITPEQYRQNMEEMIIQLKEANVKIILVIENPIEDTNYYTRHDSSVFEPYGGAREYYYQNYVLQERDLAQKYDLVLMDMYQVFMDTGSFEKYISDGVHPNSSGYALYAKELKKALIRIDLGDLNGDDRVNARDYMMLKRFILGSYELTDRLEYADINQDGAIRQNDYLMLKRYVLGTYQIKR